MEMPSVWTHLYVWIQRSRSHVMLGYGEWSRTKIVTFMLLHCASSYNTVFGLHVLKFLNKDSNELFRTLMIACGNTRVTDKRTKRSNYYRGRERIPSGAFEEWEVVEVELHA
ncbi:hypothetical protein CASFOL_010933 [Castilleja foliolosa]|uniref:Uncharacterized protein n=1 Tax=Castilleja foliolosa TaxID=1961234 RepID=A0ABD3DUH5_9LAMI